MNLCGRFSESLEEHRQALSLDPLSMEVNISLARTFYFMKQYENAITQCREILEMDSANVFALSLLGSSLAEVKNYVEAITIFEELWERTKSFEFFAMLGYACARSCKVKKARTILKEIKENAKTAYIDFYYQAYIHLALGEVDTALSCLEQSVNHHESDVLVLNIDPRFDSIKHYEKFQELVSRVGIPAAQLSTASKTLQQEANYTV
jgi:tetratricopeptide (TPR) repeat protein